MLEEPPDILHAQPSTRNTPRTVVTAKRSKPKPLVRTVVPATKRSQDVPSDHAREAIPTVSAPQQQAIHSRITQGEPPEQDHPASSKHLHNETKDPHGIPYPTLGTQESISSKRNGIREQMVRPAMGKTQAASESTAPAVIQEFFMSEQHEVEIAITCPSSRKVSEILEVDIHSSDLPSTGTRKRASPSALSKEIDVDDGEELGGSIRINSPSTASAAHNPKSRPSTVNMRHSTLLSRHRPAANREGATVRPKSRNFPDIRSSSKTDNHFMGMCDLFINDYLEDKIFMSGNRDDTGLGVAASSVASEALSKNARGHQLSHVEPAAAEASLGAPATTQQQLDNLSSLMNGVTQKPQSRLPVPRGCTADECIDLTMDSSDSSDAEEPDEDGGVVNNCDQALFKDPRGNEATITVPDMVDSKSGEALGVPADPTSASTKPRPGATTENDFPYVCRPPKARKVTATGINGRTGKADKAHGMTHPQSPEALHLWDENGKYTQPLFERSNPAIHQMHVRSPAWHEQKALEISHRPRRKAWFGQAVKRQQWLQQQDASFPSWELRPWTYPRRRDFGMSLRIQQKVAK